MDCQLKIFKTQNGWPFLVPHLPNFVRMHSFHSCKNIQIFAMICISSGLEFRKINEEYHVQILRFPWTGLVLIRGSLVFQSLLLNCALIVQIVRKVFEGYPFIHVLQYIHLCTYSGCYVYWWKSEPQEALKNRGGGEQHLKFWKSGGGKTL